MTIHPIPRACAVLALLWSACARSADVAYRKPPEDVLQALHAPETPDASLSPTNDALILLAPVRFQPFADLAQPWLSLAGVRVAPRNRSIGETYRNGETFWSSYTLLDPPTGGQVPVELPPGSKVGWPLWSADGKRYAFTRIADSAIELWLGEKGSPRVRRVEGVRLNRMLGKAVQWMPDQRSLLVKTVPDSQVDPLLDAPPFGPGVQESSGDGGPSSTYEAMNVLRNPDDERLFEHFARSQPRRIDAATGEVVRWGAPDLYADLSVSPDGSLVRTEVVHRPFSHVTAWDRFPTRIEIRDRDARPVRLVADLPLAESVPILGVPAGPRDFQWRPGEPATLMWTEALDGGDPNTKVPRRDKAMRWKAPFAGAPSELFRTEERLDRILFGPDGSRALATESDPARHWERTWLRDLDRSDDKPVLVWDRSTDDRYGYPGRPMERVRPDGTSVWLQDGSSLFLAGVGATPRGDRPFLDRFDLRTFKAERLFRGDSGAYEQPLAWISAKERRFLTRRESPLDPPDFFVRTLGKRVHAAAGEAEWTSSASRLTRFADPSPVLRKATKKLVNYKRADGLDLSFTLHLPPGAKEGDKFPAVLWAYPLDYADARTAGQVGGSPRRFARFGRSSHLYFLLRGYAVLDEVQMPVVGDPRRMYDHYREQIVADAQAAVEAAARTGWIDTSRLGVMGHSHGGLMVANLLAHTRLFRAGIARSGGYNKTLTAFGFQHETRTLWQAPEVYAQVSPLFRADSIKTPLLLIHGQADANPGTLPVQSEQLYQAIRGNGGTVRLVMLPLESHGYRAIESNEHVLSEQIDWFDRWVKGR